MVIALIVVVGILVYAWVVYPAVMMGRGRRVKGEELRTGSCEQPVAILFSAHNEEAVILKRLENLAALDYPADRLRIFVGIDGGSDRTSDIALEWARSHPAVHVIVSPDNHGKMAMLKRLAGEISRTSNIEHRTFNIERKSAKALVGSQLDVECSVLNVRCSLFVFTDANTVFAPDALTRLVAPFSDPRIGGVCGKLVFKDPGNQFEQKESKKRKGLGFSTACGNNKSSSFPSFPSVQDSSPGTDEPAYWNLETRLKEAESGLDSCLGANGAIYAIRSGLFPAGIPDSTIVDDFVIGMKVREQGYRMVFEPAAVATEDLPETVRDEWRRRVRIGAGAFQALALCRSCLSPRYGLFAWMFWSHKVLRWFTPHLLLVVTGLLSCWVVGLFSGNPGAQASTTQQLNNLTTGPLLLAVVLVFGLLTKRGRKGAVYFLAMQSALFVGFLRYCRGGLKGTWERTGRGEEKIV